MAGAEEAHRHCRLISDKGVEVVEVQNNVELVAAEIGDLNNEHIMSPEQSPSIRHRVSRGRSTLVFHNGGLIDVFLSPFGSK